MNSTQKPVATVEHSLPGRVRMRLSQRPTDLDRMIALLREHAGMGQIQYTDKTRSLLIHFDPHAISTEEITLRVAFGFALDLDARPVRLLAAAEHVVMQDSAVFSGIGLLTALALRWLDPHARYMSRVEWLAGLGTAGSIVDHAYRELRQRGYFDPEVLALAYLATALVRGNVLSASVVTWLTTFGRHLVEAPSTGVEVQPTEIPGIEGKGMRYELVVGPDVDAPDRLHLGVVGLLNSALKYAMTGGGAHGFRSMWEELRDVSRVHGEVLEGYGRSHDGIPVRFR